jgi:hypothetical protein
MTKRPDPLRQVDSYFAAARIAHEYAADLHRELMELDVADNHTRALLRESAAVTLEWMPALTRPLQCLEHQWAEQDLLDPPAAEHTIERLDGELAKLTPGLAALRTRQDQIVAELLELISRARRRA